MAKVFLTTYKFKSDVRIGIKNGCRVSGIDHGTMEVRPNCGIGSWFFTKILDIVKDPNTINGVDWNIY